MYHRGRVVGDSILDVHAVGWVKAGMRVGLGMWALGKSTVFGDSIRWVPHRRRIRRRYCCGIRNWG